MNKFERSDPLQGPALYPASAAGTASTGVVLIAIMVIAAVAAIFFG